MSRFTVIDIETTGLKAGRDKITEIAIVKFDGSEIIDTFQTLINPEIRIPSQITRLTGISNEMVEDAPYFYEIAKDIVEWTAESVFVAHNVNFDYRFIQEEFRSLGFTFSRKKLCTVRMSKKAFPGLRSYSLGNLIREFGIEVTDRHRALDDALATTELLRKIMHDKNATQEMVHFINQGVNTTKLPEHLNIDIMHALPEYCGVYFFEDLNGNVVYVGKAKNIKQRIFQHFSESTEKADRLWNSVAHISTTETGSELYALLLEDAEIKRLKPPINSAQKRDQVRATIHFESGDYDRLRVHSKLFTENTLNSFTSPKTAKAYLYNICEDHQLCACHCGLNTENPNSCMDHHTGKCTFGPFHHEDAEAYNERVASAKENVRAIFQDDFLLMDTGRNVHEKVVFSIKDGYCDRIGFISNEDGFSDYEEIYEQLDPYEGGISANKIILGYIQGNKVEKIKRK